MSILDVFRSDPAPPAPPVSEIPEAPKVSGHQVPPPKQEEIAKDPMDSFSGLWDNTPIEGQEVASTQPNFKVRPEELMKAASTVDFSKAINPDLLAVIKGGGDEASTAMIQAMNTMVQAVYAQSAQAATKIAEASYKKTEESLLSNIDTRIKSAHSASSLLTENPALSHAAAQPIIGALQQQISNKFPNSTSAEQVEMAKNYLIEFSNILTPKPEIPEVKPEFDWETFLS